MSKKIDVNPDQIEILSEDDLVLEFLIKNININTANIIRRALITHKTYSISSIDLFQNESENDDYMLYHRLSLIPLKLTSDQIQFVCNIKTDKNYTRIRAKHFFDEQYLHPRYRNVIVTTLQPNSKIILSINIDKNENTDNCRYRSVQTCTFELTSDPSVFKFNLKTYSHPALEILNEIIG